MAPPIIAPDLDSLLLLESPFARMPYEDLRRRLRTHQRIVEREYGGLNTLAAGLAGSDKDDALKKLDSMIERVKGVKVKLTPLSDDFKTSIQTLQTRTAHLAQIHNISAKLSAPDHAAVDVKASDLDTGDVDPTSAAQPSTARAHQQAYQEWADVRLQRMITDWLLRRGYIAAAETFVKSRDIEALTDFTVFRELHAIRASLIPPSDSSSSAPPPSASTSPAPRSCALALAWCMDNKVALRRIKSTLEFDLRVQEFIDLCRVRTPESLSAAIGHARKHLLPLFRTAHEALHPTAVAVFTGGAQADADDEDSAEEARRNNERIVETVSRAMGLLAIAPGGWAYEDLYSYTRYKKLYETLLEAALHIHSLPPQPILHIALSAGLSSLKVPACYRGQRGDPKASEQAEPSAWLNPIDEDLLFKSERDARTSTPEEVSKIARARTRKRVADEMRNENCPICSTVRVPKKRGSSQSEPEQGESEETHESLGLGTLAREVPWSYHSNSTIVCRITGKVIDDTEAGGAGAVMLPNGRVYSRRALEPLHDSDDEDDPVDLTSSTSAAALLQNLITCPRTGMKYHKSEIKRVYIT